MQDGKELVEKLDMCDRGIVFVRADELITNRTRSSMLLEPFLLTPDESGDVRSRVLPWGTSQSHQCKASATHIHGPRSISIVALSPRQRSQSIIGPITNFSEASFCPPSSHMGWWGSAPTSFL